MVRVVQEKCSQLKALIVSVFTFSFVIVGCTCIEAS